jgi:putative addiction module component (TIGR02574 family)
MAESHEAFPGDMPHSGSPPKRGKGQAVYESPATAGTVVPREGWPHLGETHEPQLSQPLTVWREKLHFAMTATLNSLYTSALELTDDSRLQLVELLIPTIQSDPSLEIEQLAEVSRRIDDVRSGRVTAISGEQVFREIEQSLVARRKA